MARKKKRSRRRNSFSILNALEAYVYASILTEGVAGTSPIGLITGEKDITQVKTLTTLKQADTIGGGSDTYSMVTVAADGISLSDIMAEPTLALGAMSSNFQRNLLPMALAGFTTSISFRVGKRLLRKPLRTINSSIIKPALGAGIRL